MFDFMCTSREGLARPNQHYDQLQVLLDTPLVDPGKVSSYVHSGVLTLHNDIHGHGSCH